jgi:hypothetical protein
VFISALRHLLIQYFSTCSCCILHRLIFRHWNLPLTLFRYNWRTLLSLAGFKELPFFRYITIFSCESMNLFYKLNLLHR